MPFVDAMQSKGSIHCRWQDELGTDARPTLDANVNVILDLFDITGVVVGFGEGVCEGVSK